MREPITHETCIPSAMPGASLFVREMHPADVTRFSAKETVLFAHGATFPAGTAFGLTLDRFSWMNFIARRSFDVFLLDVRGYGLWTRPPTMDAPSEASAKLTIIAQPQDPPNRALRHHTVPDCLPRHAPPGAQRPRSDPPPRNRLAPNPARTAPGSTKSGNGEDGLFLRSDSIFGRTRRSPPIRSPLR